MTTPLISVIVPVYRVEEYLERCVKSILSQTYKNLEVILVDDGSPDQCPAICDACAEKDARVKVIHQENKGLSGARNAGIDAASGEYLAFVDSDDYVSPHFIEELYQLLQDTGLRHRTVPFFLCERGRTGGRRRFCVLHLPGRESDGTALWTGGESHLFCGGLEQAVPGGTF